MSNSKEQRPPMVQRNLNKVLLADLLSGVATAFTVTPFLTIIDKGVIQNANGSVPLWKSVGNGMKDLMFRPGQFIKRIEFWWVYFVYAATYPAANMSESWCKSRDIDPVYPKFWSAFIVNCSASILKDRALTQIFGTVAAKKNFPIQSYGCFLVRDTAAMWFVFSMPGILGKKFSDRFGWEIGNSVKIAQLICPLGVQFIATPFHLVALDYYNNQGHSFAQRMQFLKREFGKSLIIRMIRFLPAYSIGGVMNIVMREQLSQSFDD